MTLVKMSDIRKNHSSASDSGGLVPMNAVQKNDSSNGLIPMSQISAPTPDPVYAENINSSGGVGSTPYGPAAPIQQANPVVTLPASGKPSVWDKLLHGAEHGLETAFNYGIAKPASSFTAAVADAGGALNNLFAKPKTDYDGEKILPAQSRNLGKDLAAIWSQPGGGGNVAHDALVGAAPNDFTRNLPATGVSLGTLEENLLQSVSPLPFGTAIKGAKTAANGLNDSRNLSKAAKDFIQRTKDVSAADTAAIHSTAAKSGLVQDAGGNGQLAAQAKQLADNFKNRESFQAEYEKAIDDQHDYLKRSMKDRGGVDQGGIIKDEQGDVTGRYGRISNNPPWLQEFNKQNGRNPTQAELKTLAKEQVDQGFQTEVGKAPAFQPNDLQEIDQHLQDIQDALPHVDDSTRQALEATAATLSQERARLQKAIPESISALPMKKPDSTSYDEYQNQMDATEMKLINKYGEDEYNKALTQQPYMWGGKLVTPEYTSKIPKAEWAHYEDLTSKRDAVEKNANDTAISQVSNGVNYTNKTDDWMASKQDVETALTGVMHDAKFRNPNSPVDIERIKERLYNSLIQKTNAPEELWGEYGLAKHWAENPNASPLGKSLKPLMKQIEEMANGIAGKTAESIPTPGLISSSEYKRLKASPNNDVQALTTQTPDGRPLLPVGGAGNTPKEAVKISDIVANLSKKLDIPIRVARYRQKAHGIFKIKSEVVRTKLANDLPTISHEVGHALDKQYGLGSSQFDSELIQLGRRTSGRGYTKEQIRKEGVAEFFRHMLTDPQEALKQAPNFYAHTMQILPEEVQAVLKEAQEQIKGYIDQPILAKIESKISVGKKEKKPLPTWNDLYKQFVDEQYPIRLALKELGTDGKKLMENFQLLRGVTGRAQAFLKQGVVDGRYNIVGKSFEKILEPVKADLNDFRKYLIAKRAVELEKRGIHASSDLELPDWESAVAMLEHKHPGFQSVQKEVLGYQDSVLNELVKSGMISQDSVNEFKEVNKEYVPFFREYEAEAGAGATRGGTTSAGPTLANQRNPIKRIKGSARDIVDPLESIIKNTYQYVAIAERNKAMRDFVTEAVKGEGLGGLVEKIPEPMTGTKFSLEDIRTVLEREGVDTDAIDMDAMASIFRPSQNIPGQDNVVTVFRNGKREFYQLDPELYRAVMSADKDQMGVIVRALNFPTRLLRSGVVNTLEFWLRNMWKDQFSALINSKNGYIPFIDMFRGVAHVLKKDEVFTKFLAAGGGQGLRQSLDRKYLQGDLRKILAASMKDKSLNILKHPLQAMQAFSEVSEMGTRLGEFSKGLKKDGSPQGVRSAAVAARDLIDFGRAGTIGKNINKVSAFWNSQVQGLDKTIRAFKAHPVKNFTKAAAAITAPTFGLYELNKNDPRYQELQQWDKDLFWHFWIGDAHFRLPIPFELGIIFKVLPERIMSAADGKEGAFRQFASQATNTLSPVPTSLTKALGFITALTPMMEVVSNKNFAGAPIVPRREENLTPADQYGPYTSTAAKLAAQLAGKVGMENTFAGSPRKLEHIIQGYTGSLGQYALQGTDMLANASGIAHQPPKPATGLESMPGFKAIMGKSIPDNTDSMDRFYERLDQLTKGTGSAKKHGATYDAAGEAKVYNKINGNINDLRSVYRTVLDDPDMTPEEKRAQLNDLNEQMNELAKTALGISKDLKTTP